MHMILSGTLHMTYRSFSFVWACFYSRSWKTRSLFDVECSRIPAGSFLANHLLTEHWSHNYIFQNTRRESICAKSFSFVLFEEPHAKNRTFLCILQTVHIQGIITYWCSLSEEEEEQEGDGVHTPYTVWFYPFQSVCSVLFSYRC